VEQTCEPMNKKRMRGIRCRASEPISAKPISIKGTGCKSAGCARKAVELTSGDLPFVPESGLRVEQLILTGRQKSAAGKVGRKLPKAQTVLRKEGKGSGK
jgi:hypothetical protein